MNSGINHRSCSLLCLTSRAFFGVALVSSLLEPGGVFLHRSRHATTLTQTEWLAFCDESTIITCTDFFHDAVYGSLTVGIEEARIALEPMGLVVSRDIIVEPREGVFHTVQSMPTATNASITVALLENTIESTSSRRMLNAGGPRATVPTVQEDAPYHLAFLNEGARRACGKPHGISAACQLPPTSYTYAKSGQGVVVYLVGSSVNVEHNEFADGSAVRAYDSPFQKSLCSEWYGTHVAALVNGRTVGAAKGAKVVSVPATPGCRESTESIYVARGLQWVVSTLRGAKQRNPSVVQVTSRFSSKRTDSIAIRIIEGLVQDLVSLNATVVAPVGELGVDSCSFTPAKMPSVIGVAAAEIIADIAAARSLVAYPWKESDTGECVTMWAPGTFIESAFAPETDRYAVYSGTGQAAALVAGAVAMILEVHPLATPAEVRDALAQMQRPDVMAYSLPRTTTQMLQIHT